MLRAIGDDTERLKASVLWLRKKAAGTGIYAMCE